MGIAVRNRSRLRPSSYDAVFVLPGGKRVGVMLEANPYDIQAEKLNPLQSVVPTDYRPGSEDPTIEGTRRWLDWTEGAGRFLRDEDLSHDYAIADGVDASLGGVARLGPASTTVTPAGAGITLDDIMQIIEYNDGTNRRLYALTPTQVWRCTGDPLTGANWALSKDFSTLAAPAAPTVIVQGANDTLASYTYKVVAEGPLGVPISDASLGTIVVGNSTLDGAHYNRISWSAVAGAYKYIVYRTASSGTPGSTGKIYENTFLTIDDTGLSASGAPAAGSGQVPTQMMTYFYAATNYLYVGTTQGTYWRFDGTNWTQALDNGSGAAAYTDSGRGEVFAKSGSPAGGYFFRGVSAAASANGNHVYRTPVDGFDVAASTSHWSSFSGDMGEFPYTSLQIVNDILISFTSGGIRLGSTVTTVYDLTPFATNPDTDNGRNSVVWADGKGERAAYAPYGNSLLKIVPSSFQDARIESIGIERLLQNTSAISGYPTACIGHGNYFLYFTIYNPTTNITYLGKLGTWLDPDGKGSRWEWVPNLNFAIAKWSGVKARSIYISSVDASTHTTPRLWIGMDDGTMRVIRLPALSPNPKTDSNCRYLDSGYLYLPGDDAGFGANKKNYHGATVIGQVLNQDQTATLSFAKDGSATYTDIGDAYTKSGERKTFPEDQNANVLTPRLLLETSDSTLSPEVSEVQIHAQVTGLVDADGNPAFRRKRRMLINSSDLFIKNDGLPDNLHTSRRLRDDLQQVAAAPSCKLLLSSDPEEKEISVLNYSEGVVMGPMGQEVYAITLDYLETALANGVQAGGVFNADWES